MSYRCYFLDDSDRVTACEKIPGDHDAQASECADGLLAAGAHAAVEVWELARKVYRADRSRLFASEQTANIAASADQAAMLS